MAFNSIEFILFFPLVLGLYYAIGHRYRWMLLLAASYYFYMAWHAIYALLLLGATVVAFVGGLLVARCNREGHKKAALMVALLMLIGTLFIYKYFNFFNDSLRYLLERMDLNYSIPGIQLILPLGISFFTFQKIAYLVDVYQKRIPAEEHFGSFALFASYFPQLVAGPIERAKNLLPELSKRVNFDYSNVSSGIRQMCWGFFKKIVVADHLAPMVDTAYGSPEDHGGLSLAAATVYFAFQVYCDFSGYSDIAIGAARTMGIKLMDNFRQPYFATSISDFWKRWHISLSTWLTDYVYTPLTKARWIRLKWYSKFLLCLFLTFLVSGLWHGANWTYVAWGALHGGYLVSSMLSQTIRAKIVQFTGLDRRRWLLTTLRIMMTFSLVCVSYIFFRSESLHDAMYILTHMVSPAGFGNGKPLHEMIMLGQDPANFLVAMVGIAVVLLVDGAARYDLIAGGLAARPWWIRWPAYYVLIAVIVLLGSYYQNAQSFIYFQF